MLVSACTVVMFSVTVLHVHHHSAVYTLLLIGQIKHLHATNMYAAETAHYPVTYFVPVT